MADDRLRGRPSLAIVETIVARVVPRMSAISLSASQKALSRLTLELRPLIVTYLLTIADLGRASPDGELLSIAEG